MKYIVLIHGLGGSPEETWQGAFAASSLEKDLGDIAYLKPLKVISYTYRTFRFRFPFSKMPSPAISTLVDGLRSFIEAQCVDAEHVTFLAHSLGGLIARQYALDDILNERMTLVNKIVLLATPNGGSDLAKIASELSWKHTLLKQLCLKSEFLFNLNGYWNSRKLSILYDTYYVAAANDALVDPTDVKMNWIDSKKATVSDEGHISISKPADTKAVIYTLVKAFIQKPPSPAKDYFATNKNKYPLYVIFDRDYRDPRNIDLQQSNPTPNSTQGSSTDEFRQNIMRLSDFLQLTSDVSGIDLNTRYSGIRTKDGWQNCIVKPWLDDPKGNYISYASSKINIMTSAMLKYLSSNKGISIYFVQNINGNDVEIIQPDRDSKNPIGICWEGKYYYYIKDTNFEDYLILMKWRPRYSSPQYWWIVAGCGKAGSIAGKEILFNPAFQSFYTPFISKDFIALYQIPINRKSNMSGALTEDLSCTNEPILREHKILL